MKIALRACAASAALAAPLAPAQEVKQVEQVVVTASPLGRAEAEMAQPASVIDAEALRRNRAASIGDTLAQQPGVQSSAFGAAAGRPIIRGLDGPRIRVLENGIGTLDASSVSPDHAVTTESLRADRIEILRGPASLLYGSGAIGGIVNVVSGLIPRERAPQPSAAVEARAASGNRERTGAASFDTGPGDSALHLDAFSRRASDYRLPDGTRLADSDVHARGAGAGASWIGARGFAGLGVQGLANDYGVPTGEGVAIRLRQSRFEGAGELADPLPGFERLKVRLGHNRYRHSEVEGDGAIATTFRNRATESRLELQHGGALRGTLGAQWQDRELSALGEEAILPKTRARAAALFVVEEKAFGPWVADAGVRIEREERVPEGELPRRRFSLVSPATGLVWTPMRGYRLGIAATQARRAPSVEELYSRGAHHATATFDIGNPELRPEVSRNVDVVVRKVEGAWRWKVNLYANRIADYVFAAPLDTDGDGVADRVDEEGGLDPEGEFLLQAFSQAKARFRGAEVELAWRPEGRPWGARLFGDLVRGRLANGENLPRIPPARVGLGFDARSGAWSASATALHAFAQRRTAPLETPTPAYTRVDAEVAWRLEAFSRGTATLFLQGSNLLDREIRVHTSYLKDVAPQMGRSFTLGVRAEF